MKPDSTAVAVIVPVFRNLAATQRCIESVLASDLGPHARLIIIDDDSPEPEISAWCEQLRARDEVTLLRNPQNLGFVATVNRGIEASGDADVVLLNSDTEVANDWIWRLQTCAYSNAGTGTVTPLSNNASVCSYPLPSRENAMPAGWSIAAMDTLASSINRGGFLELPTAVGFCMYIRRACIDATGLFDEENFGIGYGEECDFSMRAKAAGWINALCPEVFVYHEGGQSFAGQTSERIIAAENTLRELHPQYHIQATQFIDEDPVRPFRDALDGDRLARSPEDALSIIAALQSHRDTLIDSRTNREMSLEHAYGETRSERDALGGQVEEVLAKLADVHGRLSAVQASLGDSQQALASVTEKLDSTNHEFALTRQELARLRQRDGRWRYVMALINRIDTRYMQYLEAKKTR